MSSVGIKANKKIIFLFIESILKILETKRN